MRLKDLMEQHVRSIDKEIQQNCKRYIKEIRAKHGRLFRGINSREPYIKKQARMNRRPMTSPQEIHDAFNKAFVHHYNYPFRNGVFCTPSFANAGYYGRVYEIYPADPFEYVWSPTIEDLVDILEYSMSQLLATSKRRFRFHPEVEKYIEQLISEGQGDVTFSALPKKYLEPLCDKMVQYEYIYNKQLEENLSHEVMVKCQYYYGILESDEGDEYEID